MKEKQIHAAIAEFSDPLVWINQNGECFRFISLKEKEKLNGQGLCGLYRPLTYLEDLDACHQILFNLPRHLKEKFADELRNVLERYHVSWTFYNQAYKNYLFTTAPTTMICEAFIKTVCPEKWIP